VWGGGNEVIWYDIFNCNWVATRWQLFSTHIHTKKYRERHKTNDTENTKIHRTTQKIHRATQQLGRVQAVPRLCGFYRGICLTTEEKARKNLSHGRFTIVDSMKIRILDRITNIWCQYPDLTCLRAIIEVCYVSTVFNCMLSGVGVKKVKQSHYRPSGLWGSGRLRLQNF